MTYKLMQCFSFYTGVFYLWSDEEKYLYRAHLKENQQAIRGMG